MGIIVLLVNIYSWGLIVYVLLSWFRTPGAIQIYQSLGKAYKPLLDPISDLLAPIQKNLGIDFSPVILILILNMFEEAVRRML